MIVGWDELGKITPEQWRYLLEYMNVARAARPIWLSTKPRECVMNLPVCQCGRVMTVKRNGVRALVHDERGLEYQIWAMDEYACPDDGRTVLHGAGAKPIAEHWQPNFATEIKRAGALLRNVYHGTSPNALPNVDALVTKTEHLETEVARLTEALAHAATAGDFNELEDAQGKAREALKSDE